ncbi:Phospholysine phosphohistidine inorganic pyrophosphate phosphatase [Araneus ventricosus]|uniref:Phospholysine phosphohistidine inorganic pyrophosphate phosphatase n=1 Tax=Araneus ventricosus TaxID=182803 RepID=A0A4Y2AFG5_ARAVE|nr:Phospholysine phosphohistidine inorganic pyrophosphate phosphatase [Araneus ventricosus]
MVHLQQKEFCATGTSRDNQMAKCPLISLKSLAKTERGTSDALFDEANKIAAVRWNDNRVVSLLTNFEVTKVHSKVQRHVKGGRKDFDILFCVTSYYKYKNGVDLFDSHMENYFTSIQGKKGYWALYVNCFETTLIAAWKISKLFSPNDAQDILTFCRLRQLGIAIRFITNDSRRTPAELVKKLQSLGFTVSENEICSPLPVVIRTLETLGLRPYLMVHPDIKTAFDKIDQSSPNCVVIGDMGGNLSAEMFNKAYQVLTSSPSPVLVKLGNEKYYKEKNELVLGAASYAASLEYACSTEAMVVGKPCYDFIMNAINGLGICPQEILMVGDDIENDIQAAQRCGMRAILVRTGKFRPDDAKNEVIKPDTIVKNLAHLVDMLVMKSKRENSSKNSSDGMPKYPQEQKKQVNRTPKPIEAAPPVPVTPHYDVYPFRFAGTEIS